MSELYVKSQNKLELNRVLEMLSACAGSADGKKACLSLLPTSDLDEVRARLEETTVASNLSTKRGYPGFGDVRDVTASLDRAQRGGTLQPIELIRIAGILRCARNVKDYLGEDEEENVLSPLFHMNIKY